MRVEKSDISMLNDHSISSFAQSSSGMPKAHHFARPIAPACMRRSSIE